MLEAKALTGRIISRLIRWQEASDMLEARRLNLAHANPEGQLSRLHVDKILRLLFNTGSREMSQSELASRLDVKLTSGRITQLLGPLEAHGLISKRKHGRDNLLQLTETGHTIAEQQERKNGSTDNHNPERAGSYLRKSA